MLMQCGASVLTYYMSSSQYIGPLSANKDTYGDRCGTASYVVFENVDSCNKFHICCPRTNNVCN